MRVISGKLGGRIFDSPHGHRTHPMSDKVRGALFNALGDVSDLTVLDAFGGTGAISFEAISRGAKHSLVVESDRKAQQTIEDNIFKLSLRGHVKLIRANLGTWLKDNSEEKFDVIIADPPYDDLQRNLIQELSCQLNKGGTFVLSWPGGEETMNFGDLKEVMKKDYGDAQLVFYKQFS